MSRFGHEKRFGIEKVNFITRAIYLKYNVAIATTLLLIVSVGKKKAEVSL